MPRKPEDITPTAPETLDSAPMERRRRGLEVPAEASLAITALVELHRATAGEGPTRYLEAARSLGDSMAEAILDN